MEEDKMGFERLYKNLIDIIKEEQAKLGFRREAILILLPLSEFPFDLMHMQDFLH